MFADDSASAGEGGSVATPLPMGQADLPTVASTSTEGQQGADVQTGDLASGTSVPTDANSVLNAQKEKSGKIT